MRDRPKRLIVSSWVVFFFWCTVVILCFNFSALRLLFTGYHPRLIPKWNIPAMESVISENQPTPPGVSIQQTVIFPDQALVFLKYPPSTSLITRDAITCVYSSQQQQQQQLELPPSSIDDFDGKNNQQIVRCPLPPRGAIRTLDLKLGGSLPPGPTYRWDSLAYDAVIDGGTDNTTIVFVKGFNLRSGRAADPTKFKCVYGQDLSKPRLTLQSDVVSIAQEIVRCKTPLSVLNRFNGDRNTSSVKVSVRAIGKKPIDSIARVERSLNLVPFDNNRNNSSKQHQVCVCTMLRNQARFMREWVAYHSRVGVDRYFIYDNNSDDDIGRVVEALTAENHNVTRHAWPWVKTQEAGFAHCALMARDSCEWVGFIDVDEFLHLPSDFLSLRDLVNNQSRPSDVAELRVSCRSFGPSGFKTVPARGVTVGYTCRMALPERHKSIVRPEALDSSLMNVVHHFRLKPGFNHVNIDRSVLVINHYKYQVWEVFKEKFYRRVATYVSDWQQERNVGSKDRAPGLGTKPVEPSDWSTRFCEVKDTRLRDRVLQNFTDPNTGLLPWEDRSLI